MRFRSNGTCPGYAPVIWDGAPIGQCALGTRGADSQCGRGEPPSGPKPRRSARSDSRCESRSLIVSTSWPMSGAARRCCAGRARWRCSVVRPRRRSSIKHESAQPRRTHWPQGTVRSHRILRSRHASQLSGCRLRRRIGRATGASIPCSGVPLSTYPEEPCMARPAPTPLVSALRGGVAIRGDGVILTWRDYRRSRKPVCMCPCQIWTKGGTAYQARSSTWRHACPRRRTHT